MNHIRNNTQVNLVTAVYDDLDKKEKEYIQNSSKHLNK
jgi:hypothetical protein